MKTWQILVFGILCGLLAAGLILLVSRGPRGAALELPSSPTQAPILVDVSGAVVSPGVYQLPPGSRVKDAITAAGGLLPAAFTDPVNMAAPLIDGAKVLVPSLQQTNGNTTGDPADTTSFSIVFPISINSATLEQLMELPGIGEEKANAIIEFRNTHGPFTSLEQVQDVPGIGPGIYEQIKDLITIY